MSSEAIFVKGVEIRRDWADLNALPEFPACPLVGDLDLAGDTIDQALEAGIISASTAGQRMSIVNLRRIALANAQAEYGCRGTCETGEIPEQLVPTPPGQLTPDLLCGLPTGRVEAYAFGSSAELFQTLVDTQNNNQIGY